MSEEVREQILDALKGGPLNRAALRVKVPTENDKQLSNALYELRVGRKIEKMDGNWQLRSNGDNFVLEVQRAPTPKEAALAISRAISAARPPARKLPAKRIRIAVADMDLEAKLERSVKSAEDALNHYFASVGNPAIAGPLREARDRARDALENYRSQRNLKIS